MKNFQLKMRKMFRYFCPVPLIALVISQVISHAADTWEWDIEKVVETALQNSEAIIQAREEIRKKELDLQMLRAVRSSSLTVSTGRTRMKNPLTGEYEIFGEEEIKLNIPLTPKLVVESSLIIGEPALVRLDYYPLAENVEEARAQLDLSLQQLEFQKIMVQTELEARKRYIELLAAEKSLRQAKEDRMLAEKTLAITEYRFQAGLVGKTELEKAKVGVLETRMREASVEMREQTARQSLSCLLKVDLSEAKFAELPEFPIYYLSADEMLENALANDVELKRARLLLIFAQENLERIKKNKPVIVLGAKTDTENWEWELSAGLTWTINAAYPERVKKAEIEVIQQERAVNLAVETVEDSLTAVIKDFEMQRMNIDILEYKKDLAGRAYIDAQRKYEQGEILLIDLERARLQAQEAQDDFINGWNNLWQAWYSLLAIIAV